MVQLSTLQMPVFTQQRPNIWATSQLISSEQFKWGSWLLNLSAFDYITPPFPSMVSILSAFPNSGLSKIPIPVLWPSAWMHPAHSTSIFLPFAIQLPMHKRSPLLLIKIPPNSLSFLSLGLQVTEKQPCFIWPSWRQSWHMPPAGYLPIQSTSVSCQATNPAVPVHLTSSKLHSCISWLPAQQINVFAMGSC